MPSKSTIGLFIAGTVAILIATWLIADLSVKEGALFLASMLIGGALYWSRR